MSWSPVLTTSQRDFCFCSFTHQIVTATLPYARHCVRCRGENVSKPGIIFAFMEYFVVFEVLAFNDLIKESKISWVTKC